VGAIEERAEDRPLSAGAVPGEAFDVDPAIRSVVESHQRVLGLVQNDHRPMSPPNDRLDIER
jgi:hypothetical protein